MLTEVHVQPTCQTAVPLPSATLLRLWRLSVPHRPLLYRALLCTAVLGGVTGLFAALVGPALRFLLTGGGLSDHGPSGLLKAALRGLNNGRTLLWLFPTLVAGLGALKGLAYLGQFYAFGWFGQRISADLRRSLFLKLSALSPTQRSVRLAGDLEARLTQDVVAVEMAATYTVGAYLRDGIQLVVLGGLAFALDWRLALVAVGVLPLAAWPAGRLSKLFLEKTRSAQAQGGALAGQIQEGLSAVRTIQAFGAEPAEAERFVRRSQAQRRILSRAAWNRGAVPALMEVLSASAVAGILAWAATGSEISPERLISFLAAVVLVYQPTKELGRVGAFALQAAAAGERIFGILDLPDAVADPVGLPAASAFHREIRIEGVRFSYGERFALDGISLVLRAGETTALVGASGSGKSTVAQLLLRFEDPSSGRITLDGTDLRALSLVSLRSLLALVTQEPLLFSTTVLENIRVGRLDATVEEIKAAARAAGAEPFIEALPQGYQTQVGERGAFLSGGQKQRVCLARAALSGAPIWILDEPTSSLDAQSEREVEESLAALLPGRTAVVVAHRLSTIASANMIHVLEAGRVVESGSHATLLALGGSYARLWNRQQGAHAA